MLKILIKLSSNKNLNASDIFIYEIYPERDELFMYRIV